MRTSALALPVASSMVFHRPIGDTASPARDAIGAIAAKRNRVQNAARIDVVMMKSAQLLRDDPISPLDEPDKDRWIAEFRAPLREIGISHSAGTGTRAT